VARGARRGGRRKINKQETRTTSESERVFSIFMISYHCRLPASDSASRDSLIFGSDCPREICTEKKGQDCRLSSLNFTALTSCSSPGLSRLRHLESTRLGAATSLETVGKYIFLCRRIIVTTAWLPLSSLSPLRPKCNFLSLL
jgi:hypothetical protein